MEETKSAKQQLIDLLLHDPLEFASHFFELVRPETQLTFADLRSAILRLYDLNERSLLEESNANKGAMGFFNRLSTSQRKNKFNAIVKNGFRNKARNKLILVEGDSWFQFPVFVSDIIDWLMNEKSFLIYSIAYGGDWLTNIIYEGQYVEELSVISPDVFLISGSGNDLVGSNRLASMVHPDLGIGRSKTPAQFRAASFHLDDDLNIGRLFLAKEFYSFVWLMKAQYWLIFRGIEHSGKFPNMQIITQGYDNAVPSFSRSFSWRYPWKPFINAFVDTGCWLKRPLLIKGIPDQYDLDGKMVTEIHRKIVKTMIHEMNEMFISLTVSFKNVYHIDARGVAKGHDDWFDELHLKSHVFKKVAHAYKECIDGFGSTDKVVKAKP